MCKLAFKKVKDFPTNEAKMTFNRPTGLVEKHLSDRHFRPTQMMQCWQCHLTDRHFADTPFGWWNYGYVQPYGGEVSLCCCVDQLSVGQVVFDQKSYDRPTYVQLFLYINFYVFKIFCRSIKFLRDFFRQMVVAQSYGQGLEQGSLTGREGSVQLTSSLR
jgi:hypothetical protein